MKPLLKLANLVDKDIDACIRINTGHRPSEDECTALQATWVLL